MTPLQRCDLLSDRKNRAHDSRVMLNKRGGLIGKLGGRSNSRLAGNDGSDSPSGRVLPSDSMPWLAHWLAGKGASVTLSEEEILQDLCQENPSEVSVEDMDPVSEFSESLEWMFWNGTLSFSTI